MKYAVFLDFDGVLTTARTGFADAKCNGYTMWSRFDPVAIDFLNKIHLTFEDVKFVWITSWRPATIDPSNMDLHFAYTMFRNAGFLGEFADQWRVNPENTISRIDRALEIKDWIDKNPIIDYLIFDDCDYKFNEILGKKRLIRTDPNDGITYKNMQYAWNICGQWYRK